MEEGAFATCLSRLRFVISLWIDNCGANRKQCICLDAWTKQREAPVPRSWHPEAHMYCFAERIPIVSPYLTQECFFFRPKKGITTWLPSVGLPSIGLNSAKWSLSNSLWKMRHGVICLIATILSPHLFKFRISVTIHYIDASIVASSKRNSLKRVTCFFPHIQARILFDGQL